MRSGLPVVDVNAKLGTMTDPPDTPEIQHIKDASATPDFVRWRESVATPAFLTAGS